MQFDPENKIVKLCAQGMVVEHEGKAEEAARVFQQAWTESETDFEKFISAHYLARHQATISDKLKWDLIAMDLALDVTEQDLRGSFPSLYLNIAKGYEDLQDFKKANDNYEKARSYVSHLKEDGYGRMIRAGIKNGIERIKRAQDSASGAGEQQGQSGL